VRVCVTADCGDIDPRTDSEERLKQVDPRDFVLQMPDNTRLNPDRRYVVERELDYTDLLPGDPVRGLLFFKRLRERSRVL
jgi:hypothetical protein